MKTFLYIIGIVSGLVIAKTIDRKEPHRPNLYECPCEVEQLVTDVISHTNKDSMTTVTTYIDIKDCIQSNTN